MPAWTWTILYRNSTQALCGIPVGFGGRRLTYHPDLPGNLSLKGVTLFSAFLSHQQFSVSLGMVMLCPGELDPAEWGCDTPRRKVPEDLPSKGAGAEDVKLTPCPMKPKYFQRRAKDRTLVRHLFPVSSVPSSGFSSLVIPALSRAQMCHINVRRPFLGQTFELCPP